MKCGNCRFWEKTPMSGGGACRRYPPTPMILPTATGPTITGQFPLMAAESPGCGEYSPKSTGVVDSEIASVVKHS